MASSITPRSDGAVVSPREQRVSAAWGCPFSAASVIAAVANHIHVRHERTKQNNNIRNYHFTDDMANRVENLLLAYGLYYLICQRRRRVRRWWVHPLLRHRHQRGEYRLLVLELRLHQQQFRQYFRMTVSDFDELLAKIAPLITRANTGMRMAIGPGERLAICLRVVDDGGYGRTSDSGRLFNSAFGEGLRDGTLEIPPDASISGAEQRGPLPFVFVGDEDEPYAALSWETPAS